MSAPHPAEAPQGRPIAVVTVCKNPGPILKEAVRSVAALGDARVRHIVIDGASDDGTPAYLASLGHRLFHWRSERDRGVYDAMNKGWAAAPPSAYVLFLGADDRLISLPTPGDLLEAEAAGVELFYGTTQTGATSFPSRWGDELRFRNTLHHQSMMVSKSTSAEPPFDLRYAVYGDWDWNLRLWKRGVRSASMPSLRAYASPGGVSARAPLREGTLVAFRNSGLVAALHAASLLMLHRLTRVRAVRAAFGRDPLPSGESPTGAP